VTAPLPLLDPLPLPAPAWLLSALLTLTFVVHVLSMNLLLGGSILGVAARIQGRQDRRAAAFAHLLAEALPIVFAATVTFGVAALLFLQTLYGRVFFAGAVLLAVPWLLIVPLVILAYYLAYAMASLADRAGRGTRDEKRGTRGEVRGARDEEPGPRDEGRGARGEERGARTEGRGARDGERSDGAVFEVGPWLGSAALALLVLGVGFIQANVMSALLRPHLFGAWFLESASGLRLNLGDATLAPRFLHVVIGAIGVAGAAVALAGYFLRHRDAPLSAWMIRHGVYWCAGATTVNLLPGFWWLAALPAPTMLRFMGRDLAATLWLVGGIVSALAALGHLIPAGMTREPRSLLLGGAGSLVASVACMVMVRDVARRAALEAAGVSPARWVAPQWGAIAAFGALLVCAIAIVAWMVRAMARAPRSREPAP
jgi:hypothetical protein